MLNNNDVIIKAHGFSFVFVFLVCTFMFLTGLTLAITIPFWFCKEFTLIESIFSIIAIIIGLPWIIYEIYNLFKKAKVLIKNNTFITYGKDSKFFPPIKKDCKDFLSYTFTTKLASPCIEFTFINGKKTLFSTVQFTNKQILQILTEIQKRGGLQNQEIKLSK